ncbi:MAG TPA: TrmH family RNA methyltransferase, partial [Chloroflexota bacterium]|nr:TrmH family RNA methyltransferase [Chloroflexota bacterium]
MISSTSNARVRLLRSLDDRRARARAGLFLVEGVRLAEEVVDAGARPALVLYDERLEDSDRGRQLLADLAPLSAWLEAASPHVLASVSAVQHTQGIVLAVPQTMPPPPQRRQRPGSLHDVVLLLDDVADPGNAGAVLRTARAADVGQVHVSAGSVDVFGPKVVRAAGGAHFRLQLAVGFRWQEGLLAPEGTPVLLAEAQDGQPYWQHDWTTPAVVVVGGEARGASASA